jgi:RNA polymerase sigma-70 factor (ECF subfamily)
MPPHRPDQARESFFGERLENAGARNDHGAMPGLSALAMVDAPSVDEGDLLRRASSGEHAAALALFRAHGARVHRTASRILGENDGDVEDVVQQTFLAAFDGAASFDARASVATWLVGIATRRALDLSRSRARRARWGKVASFLGLPGIAPTTTPDAPLEQRTLVERALGELTPDQRAVFVLSGVEGYTLQEIADMTGTGVSTLHARLAAARKRLDAYLASLAQETTP